MPPTQPTPKTRHSPVQTTLRNVSAALTQRTHHLLTWLLLPFTLPFGRIPIYHRTQTATGFHHAYHIIPRHTTHIQLSHNTNPPLPILSVLLSLLPPTLWWGFATIISILVSPILATHTPAHTVLPLPVRTTTTLLLSVPLSLMVLLGLRQLLSADTVAAYTT